MENEPSWEVSVVCNETNQSLILDYKGHHRKYCSRQCYIAFVMGGVVMNKNEIIYLVTMNTASGPVKFDVL